MNLTRYTNDLEATAQSACDALRRPALVGHTLLGLTLLGPALSSPVLGQTVAQQSDVFSSLQTFELMEARQPRGNSDFFLMDVETAEYTWTLALERHNVWAPDAVMVVIGEGGERAEYPLPPSDTYRGRVLELEGSSVSGSISADGFFAIIEAPGIGRRTIEPTGLGDGLAVFYSPEDAIPQPGFCGAPTLHDLRRDPRDVPQPSTGAPRLPRPGHAGPEITPGPGTSSSQLGTGTYIAELAIDTDYEYYVDLGSNPTTVRNRVAQVMNSTNFRYERDLDILHAITTIIVRTSSNDPYTSTDPATRLTEMTTWWNDNGSAYSYDVAHLFTGADLNSNVVGIADIGAICSAYGITERRSSFNDVVQIVTHELGHNWGANHCNEAAFCNTSLPCNYMCSDLNDCTGANEFGQCAIDAITAYRDDNLDCLDVYNENLFWVKLSQSCMNSCVGSQWDPFRQIRMVNTAVSVSGAPATVRIFPGSTFASGEVWPVVIDRPMTIEVWRGPTSSPNGVVVIDRP